MYVHSSSDCNSSGGGDVETVLCDSRSKRRDGSSKSSWAQR